MNTHTGVSKVTVNPVSKGLHECHFKDCGRIFNSTFNLAIHFRTHFAGKSFYYCTWRGCGKKFCEPTFLKTHSLIHYEEKKREKNYICHVCGSRFFTEFILNQHIKSHENNTDLETKNIANSDGNCYNDPQKICSRTFPSSHPAVLDWQDCGKVSFQNLNSPQIELLKRAEENDYLCDVCGFRTSSESNFVQHSRIHQKNVEIDEPDDEEPMPTCPKCAEIFDSKFNLAVHLKIHWEKHTCEWPNCGKNFTQKSYMKRHMKIHSKEKIFACDICGFRSVHKYILEKHATIHNKNLPPKKVTIIVFKKNKACKLSNLNENKLKGLGTVGSEPKVQFELPELKFVDHRKPYFEFQIKSEPIWKDEPEVKEWLNYSEKSNFEDVKIELEVQDVKVEPKEEPLEQPD